MCIVLDMNRETLTEITVVGLQFLLGLALIFVAPVMVARAYLGV